MKKPRRIVRKLLLLFIFILPLTAFLAYRYTRTIETILPFILAKATSNGIHLQIEKMSGSIVTGIKTDSISLFFPESNLTIKASRAEADFSIWDIIKGNLGFSDVRIRDVDVTILAGSSDAADTTGQSGGFPILPHLDLEHIDIENFRIELPSGVIIQGEHLGGDLYADSLEVFLDLMAEGTEVRPYTGKIEKILIEANGNGGKYDITKFQFTTNGDIIETRGSITFPESEPANFSLDLEARIANLNRWLANRNRTPFLENATANLDMNFEGSYIDFYAPVKIAHSNSQNLNIEEGTVNIFYNAGEWYLDHLVLATNFGHIEGTFGYSHDDHFYALANLENIYLDSARTGEQTVSFDGWLNIALKDMSLQKMTGSAGLILNNFSWEDFQVKQFNFYAEAEDGLITILDNSKVAISDESTIILDGTFNNKNEVDFTAFAHKNQLTDYSEPLAGVPVKGVFTGFINITGHIDNPSIFADIQVDTLQHEYFSLDNASLQANILDIISRRRGSVNLLSYGGNIMDQPVQLAKMDLNIEKNVITVNEAVIKDQRRYFRIRGVIDLNIGNVQVDSMDAKYDFYEFTSSYPFDFSWANGHYSGSKFNFADNYGGSMQGSSWTYPLSTEKSIINIDNMDLGRITKLFGDQYAIGGKLSVIAEGQQLEDEKGALINGLIIADNLDYGGFDIEQLTIRGKYDTSGIDLPELNISGENFSLKGSGKWVFSPNEGEPQTLKISWDNFPIQSISYFTPFFEDVKGWVNGEMDFGGSLEYPQIEINLDIENASYGVTRFDETKIKSKYADSLLTIFDSFFIFKGDTGYAAGSVPLRLNLANPEKIELRDPITFRSHAEFANKKLSTRFIPYIEAISGDIKWNISGTLNDSSLVFSPGFVHFENAEIDVTELRNKIFDASGDLRFDSSYIHLESFSGFTERQHSGFNWLLNAIQSLFTRGEINRGELIGSGLISLGNINKPKIDLGFQGTNIYLEYLPINLKTTADINDFKIVIGDEINITGDIDLQYADLVVEPDLANKLSYLYGSTGIDRGKSTQNVNMNIYIPGNATIHSEGFKLINNFKIEILGELRIFQGKNTGIIGSLEMIDGSVYYIKNFDIQYGQLNFLSPNQIDTRIDLIATRTEKGKYIIQFVLKGSLENLQYELIVRDVQSNQVIPMAEKDVITLLTLGMETQEYASDSLLVTGSDLLTEATGKALEGLARKYNFADKVEFQSKVYNPNTAGTSSIFTYGKYLTNDLYVEYQGRLSQLDVSGAYIPMPSFTWQAGNQVGIRYRINRSWSLNTTMLRTFENNNKYRIDLKWKKEF